MVLEILFSYGMMTTIGVAVIMTTENPADCRGNCVGHWRMCLDHRLNSLPEFFLLVTLSPRLRVPSGDALTGTQAEFFVGEHSLSTKKSHLEHSSLWVFMPASIWRLSSCLP